MSMHKKPLTELERAGLKAHGLDIGTPSQLSDAFRQGVAWVLASAEQAEPVAWAYEFHEFGDVWKRHVILNRPDGGANPPTAHHGNAIRNIVPLGRIDRPAPSAVVEALRKAAAKMDELAEAGYTPGWQFAKTSILALIPPEAEQPAAKNEARAEPEPEHQHDVSKDDLFIRKQCDRLYRIGKALNPEAGSFYWDDITEAAVRVITRALRPEEALAPPDAQALDEQAKDAP